MHSSTSTISSINSKPLTEAQEARLKKLERQIIRGNRLLIGVGNALDEINRDKLYCSTHTTFEQYVQDKFGFSRGHAYNLISAAKANVNIRSISEIAPTNEFQLRPLVKLEPEQQREAWQRAVAETGGNVTHNAVKAVVAQLMGKIPSQVIPLHANPIPAQSSDVATVASLHANGQAVDLLLITALDGADDASSANNLNAILNEYGASTAAHLMVFCQHYDARQIIAAAEEHGFIFGVPVIVDVNEGRNANPASFLVATSLVLHFYKPGMSLFDPTGNLLFAHGENLLLPEKPILLLADLIESAVRPSATVLDPTAGALATAEACKRTSRIFIDSARKESAAA